MGAELVVVSGAAKIARLAVSAAVIEGALTSVAGAVAAVAGAKGVALAARAVTRMKLRGQTDQLDAQASVLAAAALAAEANQEVLGRAGAAIEENFDSRSEEAYTDQVYSLAHLYGQVAQAWRTGADAVSFYASGYNWGRQRVIDAQEDLAQALSRVATVEIDWLESLDETSFQAAAEVLRADVNRSLRAAEDELTTIANRCDEMVIEAAELTATLRDVAGLLSRLVRHLPGQLSLARRGGGGRDEDDPARPHEFYPGSATRPWPGEMDGGDGRWESVWRGPAGRAYQGQIAGTQSWAGRIAEYRLDYSPPGNKPRSPTYVNFDGHTWRGQPPVEVYLEAKDGYQWILPPGSSKISDSIFGRFTDQALRQWEAMKQNGAVDARLEWHFSDPDVAQAVRDAFSDNNAFREINIAIYYTPKVKR